MHSRTTICLLTIHDGGGKMKGPLGELALKNKKRYCDLHGYAFFHETVILDKERPAPWSKLLSIQQLLLNPHCGWVFYIDADTFITNTLVTLESIIGPDRKEDIIFSSDMVAIVNTGVILIKRSPFSIVFLTRVYGHCEFHTHGWWEQAAINFMLQQESAQNRSEVAILHQRVMNSCWPYFGGAECGWHRGDFVVHFAGTPSATEEGIKHQWNIPEWLEQNRGLVDTATL